MPKKTLALISGLVIVTVILFIIAIKASNPPATQQLPTKEQPQAQTQITPTNAMAHSVLTLSPNPISVAPGGQGQVSVNIDASDNAVTAIQLELAYDPNIITNVKVSSGPLFQNPVVLIDKNNIQAGRYTYAYGITPNHTTIQGTGVVATITFTAKNAVGQKSQLALLPTSLVTARGISSSVLKSSSGTIVSVENGAQNQVQPVMQTTGTPTSKTMGY